MPLPNFIIVGATRAGTTSLHRYLQRHPDIFMSPRKELWHFNQERAYASGLSAYERWFRSVSTETMIGESTPTYLHKGIVYDGGRTPRYIPGESAVKRLHESLGEVKLVVSLRNPTDRLVSQYRKNFHQGKRSFQRRLADLLVDSENPETNPDSLVYQNRYKIHLEEVFKYFDPKNVHLMLFEEWTQDLPRALREVIEFLGGDSFAMPKTDTKAFNTALDYQYLKPAAWRGRAKTWIRRYIAGDRSAVTPSVPNEPELRTYLHAKFKEDVDFVQKCLARPLPSSWKLERD